MDANLLYYVRNRPQLGYVDIGCIIHLAYRGCVLCQEAKKCASTYFMFSVSHCRCETEMDDGTQESLS